MDDGGAQHQTGMEELGAADAVFGKRGSKCTDAGDVLRCSGASSTVIWVRDLSYVPVHWEDLGRIPPHSGP